MRGVVLFELSVKSGMPQDSILGPLLFLLFVNNLSYVVMYADDTSYLYSASNTEDLRKHMQSMLNKFLH